MVGEKEAQVGVSINREERRGWGGRYTGVEKAKAKGVATERCDGMHLCVTGVAIKRGGRPN